MQRQSIHTYKYMKNEKENLLKLKSSWQPKENIIKILLFTVAKLERKQRKLTKADEETNFRLLYIKLNP